MTREYIEAIKLAIKELDGVLGAKIIFGKEDEKQSKFRKEVNTKKDAFVVARTLIQKCFDMEQDSDIDELWYRETMVSLITSAEIARGDLVKSLKEDIDLKGDGDDIQNSIKVKSEASEDIEALTDGIRDLNIMLKGKELKIGKKKVFTGSFAETHAEK